MKQVLNHFVLKEKTIKRPYQNKANNIFWASGIDRYTTVTFAHYKTHCMPKDKDMPKR